MNEQMELNKRMYDFAQHWGDGADLNVSGVSLPDCLAYDVLSVIGRQLLSGSEQPEAVVHPAEAQA